MAAGELTRNTGGIKGLGTSLLRARAYNMFSCVLSESTIKHQHVLEQTSGIDHPTPESFCNLGDPTKVNHILSPKKGDAIVPLRSKCTFCICTMEIN